MKRAWHSIWIFWLLLGSVPAQEAVTAHKVLILMGSRFEFTAVHENEGRAWKAVEAGIAEVQRVEALISSWDPESQTSAVNRQAGLAPQAVDTELYQLLKRCQRVFALTEGAFDVTFASLDRIWSFDGSMTDLPDSAAVEASRSLIGFDEVVFESQKNSIFLPRKGMKIGFGGIGKGYAANRARKVMEDLGIANGLVNAGGDVLAWGGNAGAESWRVAVSDPSDPREPMAWLDVSGQAVVTSGNYEKFAMIKGTRYSHIIDPRTGWPVQGVKSVTLICPDAELADALATSVFVLGIEQGLALVNRLKNVECLMVDDKDEVHSSKNLELQYIGGK